jgi:hypothetical protein
MLAYLCFERFDLVVGDRVDFSHPTTAAKRVAAPGRLRAAAK